jgi:hypothetical protein
MTFCLLPLQKIRIAFAFTIFDASKSGLAEGFLSGYVKNCKVKRAFRPAARKKATPSFEGAAFRLNRHGLDRAGLRLDFDRHENGDRSRRRFAVGGGRPDDDRVNAARSQTSPRSD